MRRKKSSSENARLARELTDKPSTLVVVNSIIAQARMAVVGSLIVCVIMVTTLVIIAFAIS